ncbi:hypothetical protein L798_08887 [Zootermopsis nevadensis]|uniref:Uncharacterized protein n=1 Tax=Zootermopsis nevadensis TaxID=136037 RepID=A0A067R0W9_ZOONE|nr:hypothetical protein L798_08887 [Zootermopsis nevadensis]
MATRRLRGAAFVSSCLMMESSTSSASSNLSKASNFKAFNFLMRRLVGNSVERALRHASATSSLLQSRDATHTCSNTRSPEHINKH